MSIRLFQLFIIMILFEMSCIPHTNIGGFNYFPKDVSHKIYNSRLDKQPIITQYYVKEFYISNEGDYYCLVIELNRLAKYFAHVLEKPDRLYIDLFNTSINALKQSININDGIITRIRTGQYTSTTARLVLDTTEQVAYQIIPDNVSNRINVYIFSKGLEPKINRKRYAASNQDQIFKGNNINSKKFTPSLAQEFGLKVKTIIIDPGHGGKDPGAVSRFDGIKEKNITLNIASQLERLLIKDGEYQVFLTRNNDVFMPLEQRTAFANRCKGDLFISIHVNAHQNPDRNGIETYYLSLTEDEESRAVAAYENRSAMTQFSNLDKILSNIIKNSKIEESISFAEIIQKNIIQTTHQQNRGVKKAGFVVLIGANMPSILVEVGFLTNPKERRLVQNKFYHKMIAEAIYKGIKEYSNQLLVISENSNCY